MSMCECVCGCLCVCECMWGVDEFILSGRG